MRAKAAIQQPSEPVLQVKIVRHHAVVDREPGFDAASGGGEGDNLEPLLAGISDEVGRKLASVEAGIAADFASQSLTARRSVPRHQLAAMLAAIKLARRAALTGARQQAKAEIQGRRAAVLLDRVRPKPVAGNTGSDRAPH